MVPLRVACGFAALIAFVTTSMLLAIRQSSYWPNSCMHTTPADAMATVALPPPVL